MTELRNTNATIVSNDIPAKATTTTRNPDLMMGTELGDSITNQSLLMHRNGGLIINGTQLKFARLVQAIPAGDNNPYTLITNTTGGRIRIYNITITALPDGGGIHGINFEDSTTTLPFHDVWHDFTDPRSLQFNIPIQPNFIELSTAANLDIRGMATSAVSVTWAVTVLYEEVSA